MPNGSLSSADLTDLSGKRSKSPVSGVKDKIRDHEVAQSWAYLAARLHPIRGRIIMSLMRFWSDLNMWNKFGIAAVGAAVVLAIIASVLL